MKSYIDPVVSSIIKSSSHSEIGIEYDKEEIAMERDFIIDHSFKCQFKGHKLTFTRHKMTPIRINNDETNLSLCELGPIIIFHS